MNIDRTPSQVEPQSKQSVEHDFAAKAETHGNPGKAPRNEESFVSFIGEIVKMFLLAVVIIVPIRIFLFQPFIVRGESMEPNFQEQEYLIIYELGYKHIDLFNGAFEINPSKTFEREEIVVFRSPRDPNDFYIKRVIGMPGETIEIRDGKVYITNDQNPEGYQLSENYLPTGRQTPYPQTVEIGENEYFVMGDNRSASSDSRVFGPISNEAVIGKVLLRAYPFNKIEAY